MSVCWFEDFAHVIFENIRLGMRINLIWGQNYGREI